jgi:hypothetical protein
MAWSLLIALIDLSQSLKVSPPKGPIQLQSPIDNVFCYTSPHDDDITRQNCKELSGLGLGCHIQYPKHVVVFQDDANAKTS